MGEPILEKHKIIKSAIPLRIIVTLLFMVLSRHYNCAQTPNWFWAKGAGGNDWDKAFSITTDTLGNLYVTGYFNSSSITFGAITLSNPGVFIVKYDDSGNVLWAKDAVGYGKAYSVICDAECNVYVAGYFPFFTPTITFGSITLTSNGMFIVKYDPLGNVIWAKDAKKESSVASSIAADNLGNIFVGGSIADTFIVALDTLMPPFYNRFIAKYDTSGNPIWARGLNTFGFTNDVIEPFLEADKFGNVFFYRWISVKYLHNCYNHIS